MPRPHRWFPCALRSGPTSPIRRTPFLAVTQLEDRTTPSTAPLANPDSYTVAEDNTLTVLARGVLANDSSSGAFAIVTNQSTNTITRINLAGTPSIAGTVAVGSQPQDVAVTPDGHRALVSNLTSNTVSVLDLTGALPVVTATVAVGSFPDGIAINPAGTLAIICHEGERTFKVLDLTTAVPTVVATVTLPGSVSGTPNDSAFSADGRYALVTTTGTQTLVYDFSTATPTELPGSRMTAGNFPYYLGTDPAHTRAVAGSIGSNSATAFNLNAAPPTATGTVGVGRNPGSKPDVSAAGLAVVPNADDATVTILNVSGTGTPTVVATKAVGADPRGAAIIDSTNVALIANRSGNSISRLDLTTMTLLSPINGVNSANHIAVVDDTGASLHAVLVAGPSHGAVTLNADGSFTYTPAVNFNGTDTFTYKANDGQTDSNVTTVTITITPVNDAPVAVNDTATTNEDTPVAVAVLANDSDVDGDSLTVSAVTQGAHGAVTVNGNGTVTYAPAANYNGSDSFAYTISDGHGGTATATVTLTVVAVNAPPAFDSIGNQTVVEDATAQSVAVTGVSAGPADEAGQTVTFTAVSSNPAVVPNPTVSGTGANRTLTFQPAANANGSVTITVTADDGQSANNTFSRTFTITVTPVNDAPAAADDSFTTAEDTTLTVAARVALTPVSATAEVNNADAPTTIDGNQNTYWQGAAENPAITYDLGQLRRVAGIRETSGGFPGNPFTLFASADGATYTQVASGTLTQFAFGDHPFPTVDARYLRLRVQRTDDTGYGELVEFQALVSTGVLANDTDADGDVLSAALVAGPAHGTLGFNADGSFTYAPAANFNGTDSFTYRSNDGSLDSTVATVTITVTPVNDAPVAQNGSLTTAEDAAATGTLAATDVDNASLTYSLVTGPAHGTATITNADTGAFTYTPAANYNGMDSLTFKASDGALDSNTTTVFIIVTAVNDAPVAAADTATTNEDIAATIYVLANDSDVDGDALSVSSVTQGAHGTVVINTNGTVTYTPAANYNGSDSFSYTISDGNGGSATASVPITVTSVNDSPVAAADSYSTGEDTTLTVAAPGVLGNDSDVDGDSLTAVLVSGPAHGALALGGAGRSRIPRRPISTEPIPSPTRRTTDPRKVPS